MKIPTGIHLHLLHLLLVLESLTTMCQRIVNSLASRNDFDATTQKPKEGRHYISTGNMYPHLPKSPDPL
jgi:hypothetical protein